MLLYNTYRHVIVNEGNLSNTIFYKEVKLRYTIDGFSMKTIPIRKSKRAYTYHYKRANPPKA